MSERHLASITTPSGAGFNAMRPNRTIAAVRPADHQPVWRVDATYCRLAGKWTYLYRAVDSAGGHRISAERKRNALAGKRFLQKALCSPGHTRPKVVSMDRNPA